MNCTCASPGDDLDLAGSHHDQACPLYMSEEEEMNEQDVAFIEDDDTTGIPHRILMF